MSRMVMRIMTTMSLNLTMTMVWITMPLETMEDMTVGVKQKRFFDQLDISSAVKFNFVVMVSLPILPTHSRKY